jgi:ribosomal protein S18 acetylase RimI-like enzyme
MDAILQDFSAEKLVEGIENNLLTWMLLFGEIWEVREDDPPGVKRSISDIPMSLFNSIMDTQLKPEDVEATIQYIITDAARRNVPVLWWVGPSTRPADLASHLLDSGFVVDEDGPGMAVSLVDLKANMPSPTGLSIQPAMDEAAWLDWCRTMAAGFEIPEVRVDFAVESWRYLLSCLNPETSVAYVAYLDGKPVATSMLQLGGGVAGIYSVATIPEARRKGVGTQVTLYPLLEARSKGYRVGVIEASDMGNSVYKSLGFQEYCRVSSYVWRPKT